MARTWIISNRLPWSLERDGDGGQRLVRNAGGLVSAMMPVHQSSAAWWMGCGNYPPEMADHCRAERLVDIPIEAQDYDAYYNGAANGCLWPVFHYLPSLAKFELGWWEAYRRVNRLFADALIARVEPEDVIWVHDYQLMLVPGMVRRSLPDVRLGYFHHIPFPASEVFKVLPWRDEIAEGLLGADLVGFHTLEYARHFASVAGRLLGMDVRGEDIHNGDRIVRTGAFPLGLDTASLMQAATTAEHATATAEVNRVFAGKHLVLGVDRLDYTKGLRERLEAFSIFLRNHPEARADTVLMLLCVPSRVAVDKYAQLRQDIEQLVGRINGEFATTGNQPVHYLFQSRSLAELTALYRRADVCLVTPLRDGLNLVCKEYCAVRDDLQGVLIISEFAGASEELGEALVVNPFAIDAVADAIHKALTMPAAEQRERMMALHQRVVDGDNRAWAGMFLAELGAVAELNQVQASRRLDGPDEFRAFFSRWGRAPAILAVFDAAIFSERDRREGTLRRLQGRLRQALGDRLTCLVVTPQARPDPDAGAAWWATEFGAVLTGPDGTPTSPAADLCDLGGHRVEIMRILSELNRKVPRSRLNEGRASITWTISRPTSDMALVMLRETRHAIDQILARSPWFCASIRRGLAIRCAAAGPVQATEAVLRALGDDGRTVLLTIGDQFTDEELFRLHAARNCSVAIATPSAASTYLAADSGALLAACAAQWSTHA